MLYEYDIPFQVLLTFSKPIKAESYIEAVRIMASTHGYDLLDYAIRLQNTREPMIEVLTNFSELLGKMTG